MRKLIVIAGLFATVAAMPAFAGTACDDVKAQIAKKLDGKGVKNYSLDAVASTDVKGQHVVGTCAGGSKKIVYSRGTAKAAAAPAAAPAAKAETKPEAKAKAAEPAKAAAPAADMKGPVMTKPGAKQ